MADIRGLFPEMFKENHTHQCAAAYKTSVMSALKSISSNFSPADVSNYLKQRESIQAMKDKLVSAWEFGERPLSAAILDGTVDSIPDIWVTNRGAVEIIQKSNRYDENEEDYVETEATLSRIEIGVDYFECAKTSLERAKHYDPLDNNGLKQDKKPGEKSGLFDTFKYLYAYKNVKTRTLFDRFGVLLIAAAEALIFIGYGYWFSHGEPIFLAHLLVYIVGLAAIPTCIALIRRIPTYLKRIAFGRGQDLVTLKRGKDKLIDAEKMLQYYRIWRKTFSSAVAKGYQIESDLGASKIEALERHFDEALKEMEETIRFVREN